MSVFLLSIVTFFSTYVGGLFALRFKEKIHSIMGFTAGVLLGVTFDIFPEIIEQLKEHNFSSTGPMIALVIGFLLFHVLEKSVLLHYGRENEYAVHTHPHVGILSALALIGHSLMDGVGIGLAFQVNSTVGFIVAIAVISHDFTDGMNTVSLMLHNQQTAKRSKLFLLFDALAPVVGAASTMFFSVPDHCLILYLGFFAGFLLYIGATDILPEAHNTNSSYRTIGLTIAGVILIFIITRLV
jgi:ZIP family zinc transporter